jgi:hypothetical protein
LPWQRVLLSGAVVFERDHPMVAALGGAFGWTSEQLDDLWRTAATLYAGEFRVYLELQAGLRV